MQDQQPYVKNNLGYNHQFLNDTLPHDQNRGLVNQSHQISKTSRKEYKNNQQNNLTIEINGNLPNDHSIFHDRTLRLQRNQQLADDRIFKKSKFRRCKTQSINADAISLTEQGNTLLPKIPFYPKPYLQNTKFIDLLVKNKQLLRRGPFDLPLDKIEIPKARKTPTKLQDSNKSPSLISARQKTLADSCIKARKQVKQMVQEQKLKRKKKKIRPFFITMDQTVQEYERICEDETSSTSASNIINRVISIKQVIAHAKIKKI